MKATKSIVFLTPNRICADASGKLPSRLEVARTGYWDTPDHGEFSLVETDFQECVSHFNAGVYRVRGTEPLAGTLDHLGGDTPAAFRITKVYTEQDTSTNEVVLWADVTWTALGKEKIERDEYRYVSFEYNDRTRPFIDPEDRNKVLTNVLTGATLTNDPLFKKLKPIMASAKTGSDNKQGVTMTLEEIRAKALADLTDEEKNFLAEHKAELSDEERTKFELTEANKEDTDPTEEGDTPDDGNNGDGKGDDKGQDDAGKLEAAAKPVTITAGELANLQASAKAGLEAKAQLDRMTVTSQLKAHVDAGRLKSSQVTEAADILLAAAPALRTRIEKLLASLPANPAITGGEKGDGKAEDTTSKADQLNAAAEQMAAEKNISYGEAVRLVAAAKPELANYRDEE